MSTQKYAVFQDLIIFPVTWHNHCDPDYPQESWHPVDPSDAEDHCQTAGYSCPSLYTGFNASDIEKDDSPRICLTSADSFFTIWRC